MSWGVNISCSMDVTYKRTTQSASHDARFLLTYSSLQPASVCHATTQAQVCEDGAAMAPN